MSVGASDHNDQEAPFSNRNSYLDIVAPGKDIYSLKSGGVSIVIIRSLTPAPSVFSF
jgi:subtilisin family serine protease